MASHARLADDVGYDADLAGWAYAQADLLRMCQPAGIDWANIAEELKDLGNSQFKAFGSALEVVLVHMLMWDLQPERRGSSWAVSIFNHRGHAAYELGTNPSFRSRIAEALEPAFQRAVRTAASEMKTPLRAMPQSNPYSREDIMNRSFDWPEELP